MAGFLGGVISFPHAVDEESLHCLQRGAVILQTPYNVREGIFQWLGTGLTLGGILCTVLNDLLTRHTVLHVHIGTPCRELHRIEAVDKTIIACMQSIPLALHPLSQGWSLAVVVLDSQNGTSVAHHKYADNKQLNSLCDIDMWPQGQPGLR